MEKQDYRFNCPDKKLPTELGVWVESVMQARNISIQDAPETFGLSSLTILKKKPLGLLSVFTFEQLFSAQVDPAYSEQELDQLASAFEHAVEERMKAGKPLYLRVPPRIPALESSRVDCVTMTDTDMARSILGTLSESGDKVLYQKNLHNLGARVRRARTYLNLNPVFTHDQSEQIRKRLRENDRIIDTREKRLQGKAQ